MATVSEIKGTGKGSTKSKKEKGGIGTARRDPIQPTCRTVGPPCSHVPMPIGRGSKSGSNGFARWIVCSRCQLRLSYVPAVGAKGTSRSPGRLPADIVTALELGVDDLSTQGIALEAAEKSLMKRLEAAQTEKKDHRLKLKTKKEEITPKEEDEKMKTHRAEKRRSARTKMGAGGAGRDSGPELLAYSSTWMASPLGPVRWNKINVLKNVKRTVLCPAFRSKILIEQSWNASLDEVVAAMNDFPSFHLDHMEVCCGQSRLTACIQQMGGKAERI